MKRLAGLFLLSFLIAACPEKAPPPPPPPPPPPEDPKETPEPPKGIGDEAAAADLLARKPDLPPVAPEKAPEASPRLGEAPDVQALLTRIDRHFEDRAGQRIYIQTDKPLYKPGETIWVKSWDLMTSTLAGAAHNQGSYYELVSPKGAVVLKKRVLSEGGLSSNDFELPAEVQGGEYKLRVRAFDGSMAERTIIVSTYEPPRIKKKLEFLRKAYGPGDSVAASLSLKRPTGEALARQAVEGIVMLDGAELPRIRAKTDEEGEVVLSFALPETLEVGDGLLTVMIDDGGVTESVTRRVPILMRKVQLAFFPEGGQLVEGLSGRLYFEAKNMLGKPADLSGRILDDHDQAVARFSTYKNGLGRMNFTPATGRTYRAVIDAPAGITEEVALPLPAPEGCVLQSFDDLDGQLEALRVGVRCSEARTVTVVATLRERAIDAATIEVPEGGQAVAYLKAEEESLVGRQGVARVTVFDAEKRPLAERLVYRHRRARLKVEVTPRKKSFAPRDQVLLEVKTSTPAGEPVPAELALSVVDDTVISFADDKTGRLFETLFLEPELPGKIEEPRFFFDLTEDKSALALDLLMGTRGWRRFDWKPVFAPPPPEPLPTSTEVAGFRELPAGAMPPPMPRPRLKAKGGMPRDLAVPRRAPAKAPAEMRRRAVLALPEAEPAPEAKKQLRVQVAADRRENRLADPAPEPPPMAAPVEAAPRQMADQLMEADEAEPMELGGLERAAGGRGVGLFGGKDADWEMAAKEEAQVAWAPVRVFPAPSYSGAYDGPRTDFRETIHWAPTVRTGKDGTAAVTFYLSDAVTSFRIVTEGVAAGVAGRDETVIQSKLPFSMSVKLPLEVSAGDRLLLPLSLTNERAEPMEVEVEATFGEGLALAEPLAAGAVSIAAGERNSQMYPLEVKRQKGQVPVRFAASSRGLSDEFVREVRVVPRGFPQEVSHSGEVAERQSFTVEVIDPLEHTTEASLRVYPSPLATVTGGLDGLLREPHGCFEQASSVNYPNVMVMGLLQSADKIDPALLERSQGLLQRGYRKIVGYETPQKGYEWFGGAPGHEALTAYGLLEFADMKRVFPEVDDAMVDRTAQWLLSRRDGKGSFQRNSRALDSFGRASAEVTDAYIVYALTEAGYTDLGPELEAQAALARASEDAYLLALATASLHNLERWRGQAKAAAKRLAALQAEDGSWKRADHSITRSSGLNLTIETTALALLALLDVGGHDAAVRRGVEWLNANRGGFGQWGATQATVLAIKATLRHAEASRRISGAGSVTLKVNGEEVATLSYEDGRGEPLLFEGFGERLVSGENTLELVRTSEVPVEGGLPFSFAATYRTLTPDSDEGVPLALETELARAEAKLGENLRLTVHLKNKTEKGLPMALARVGLPAGLTFQTWQLKELVEKGTIAFYETRAREVILYFRQLEPGQALDVPLELTAYVPGEYQGPASSAYLYYGNDQKVWVGGLPVRILP
ncbi:MAG: MG2 domain-containing protein [Deltaproteobacteria bacterium]|nr:MG2 domain-containing protein [Deltaproteobacteria bacterium]